MRKILLIFLFYLSIGHSLFAIAYNAVLLGNGIAYSTERTTLPANTITTLSIAPASFCPFSSVTVSYSISGTFNSGNKFTAQLSDASGSFSSPTTIGTLASTSNGSITAIIPTATPIGTGYRIRVVSDNPVVIGSDNGTNLKVLGSKKFVVDVTSDSDNLLGYALGDVTNSLRKCIRLANENCGHDTIVFNLGAGGPFPILINSTLPSLTDNAGVTIDGWNNSGNNGTPNTIPVFNATIGTPLNANYKIILTNVPGTVPTGLVLASDNNVIKGLILQNFGDGAVSNNDIAITIAGSNNSVLGCYISMDNTGTVSGLKTNIGIKISGANNQIGNGTASGANLISGTTGVDAAGVLITSATANNNSISGNIIGLQKDGSLTVTGITQMNGVNISTTALQGNTIGGSSVGDGNVISGNTSNGVLIASSAGGQNIFGNRIGVSADGVTYVTGNTQTRGIYISNSPNNSIGGNTPSHRNIISANEFSAITLAGTATSGNKIKGNYIGLDVSGTSFIAGNSQDYGVEATTAASGNIIGGKSAGEGNVLSGNSTGILLSSTAATGNSVFGNIIGLQKDGISLVANANQNSGVYISNSPNNIIGGNTSGHRNVISGNISYGIQLTGGGSSTGNILKGNYIGPAINGTSAIVGNTQLYGLVVNANNCIIGGAGLGEGNIFSANKSRGMYLSADATGNMIKGNYFGPGSDLAAIPGSIQNTGIYIFGGATNNTIGGAAPGEDNVVAHNSTQGLFLNDPATTGNLISRNPIYSNTGKPINLNYGANQANNGNAKPVITTATFANISGTAGIGQTVEVFKNTTGNCNDATSFVGSTVADGTGNWSLVTALTASNYVLATGTDGSKNTSEFSACLLATVANTISTGVIAPFYFCTGQSVSVPYTASGTFNAGNKFTAQLSDATGSFASPINIGTITSQVSGTINAVITGVGAGAGYRIRVVADNPVTIGVDNGANININLANGGIGTWTWTGKQSNDWFDCKNWNKASVPDLSSDVIIPGGTPNNPTITGAVANCKTIIIDTSTGAIVNLNSGAGGILNIAQ